MSIAYYNPGDIAHLPTGPGVYTFYNKEGLVVYVGKAKNIRKRVGDYFTLSRRHDLKTQRMVMQIASIAYTAVNSEYEALLLEANLIKSLQPKYNILFREGKRYPYLCITRDLFPKLIIARTTFPALGKYYGPFPSVYAIKQTLEVIKKLFTFRTCNHALSQANITRNKFKVCLDFHLGYCRGPCQGLQDAFSYQKEIDQIEALLKNNFASIKKTFKEQMGVAAEQLDYKKAQHFKEKLAILDQYQSKSLVIHPSVADLDVVACIEDKSHIFVGYLYIQQGAISFTQHRIITLKLEESITDLLPLIICALRSCSHSEAKEVLLNIPLVLTLGPCSTSMPRIGDKAKLVALALQNALLCKKDFLLKQTGYKQSFGTMLLNLQQDLKLKELPNYIECFDNSNIQGDHPVAAMVCFKNGQPAKKDYRLYHIKTVQGANDVASMYEVVKRRYSYLTKIGAILPHLMVVDGGKGQLHAAVRALQEIGIYGRMALVGIAKRREVLYFPNDPLPVFLDREAPSLLLLQRLRDEAHRFALNFHRNKRSKALFHPAWESIPGIGPKIWEKLLQQFGSMQAIGEAPLSRLAEVIGPAKAKQLHDYWVAGVQKDL